MSVNNKDPHSVLTYHDWHNPSGSVSGHAFEDFLSTGTVAVSDNISWERAYVEPKPVIIVCVACGSGNVITSPCCIQCGAPMGWSLKNQQMVYG